MSRLDRRGGRAPGAAAGPVRAFSGEVGTGSPLKMRSRNNNLSEFRFHRNGIRSSRAIGFHRRAAGLRRSAPAHRASRRRAAAPRAGRACAAGARSVRRSRAIGSAPCGPRGGRPRTRRSRARRWRRRRARSRRPPPRRRPHCAAPRSPAAPLGAIAGVRSPATESGRGAAGVRSRGEARGRFHGAKVDWRACQMLPRAAGRVDRRRSGNQCGAGSVPGTPFSVFTPGRPPRSCNRHRSRGAEAPEVCTSFPLASEGARNAGAARPRSPVCDGWESTQAIVAAGFAGCPASRARCL